jgi:RNA polymerase sigma factor (sigma-70 family)
LLANAIDELPQLERLIASLHYYDELTLGEIEKVLGISESAIAQFQTKTILRLRSILRREALLAPSDKLQANLSTCSAGD